MKIAIITPAPPRSRSGNRVTAERWYAILSDLGHEVTIVEEFPDLAPDLLVALHARRSAAAVARFVADHPGRPVVVALTGTDVYGDIHRDADAQRSLDHATRLVVLQPTGLDELPPAIRAKGRVIHQSAVLDFPHPAAREDCFELCVLGHLREVKDPFRAAEASRLLPPRSRIRITHAGRALAQSFEDEARRLMRDCPRYEWVGELPRDEALRLLARSRALVLSSLLEGGANVISEAMAVPVPVLASRIPGTTGLLGADYPGYFEVGATAELAAQMDRLESDVAFAEDLRERVHATARGVTREGETEAWRRLLAELATGEGKAS